MDYLTRIRARARGEEKGVPGYLHDKLKAREFVDSLGMQLPKLHRVYNHPREFNFEDLPYNFVLKPTFSSSSFGVMVLQRYLDEYHDHLRHRDLTMDQIVREQETLMEKHPHANHRWMVEDRVEDVEGDEQAVPDDYKFFTFQGEIGLIHRTIRAKPYNKHIYFNGDFEPFDQDERLITTVPTLVERDFQDPPINKNAMLRAARIISREVPSPFVRVDMYNTRRGPVFGEFTLVPGTFFYEDREKMSPELSAHLGELWSDAERLLATKA